jgi:hypothetical protein
MSRNELIDAYRRGRISRRTFVKGMTAAGFSLAAANHAADNLRAAPAPGGGRSGALYGVVPTPDDVYPTVAPTAAATSAPTATGGATGGTTTLPNTGVGDSDSGSSLWKPVAVAGAAAVAFAASRWRKIRGSESE